MYAVNDMFSVPHGDRPQARNVLIIISTQTSLVNPAAPTLLTDWTTRVKNSGIAIFTVGVGAAFDSNQLQTLVTNQEPSGLTYFQSATSFSTLQGLVGSTVTNVCSAAAGN
jgi:hypothetical protein